MTTALEDWQGEFGRDYSERNGVSDETLVQRLQFFARAFRKLPVNRPNRILEVGANIGLNLMALEKLSPRAELRAVEPNGVAAHRLLDNTVLQAVDTRPVEKLDYDEEFDLVFTMGVLIHIPPDRLGQAMVAIYRASSRWILCAEYFNPDLVAIPYRGRADRLWKGDYGSRYLDMFPGLNLVDHGFAWKRTTGLDNLTWWLFEK
jgi:pseudaminic acid biosynthesis-associated methylase